MKPCQPKQMPEIYSEKQLLAKLNIQDRKIFVIPCSKNFSAKLGNECNKIMITGYCNECFSLILIFQILSLRDAFRPVCFSLTL